MVVKLYFTFVRVWIHDSSKVGAEIDTMSADMTLLLDDDEQTVYSLFTYHTYAASLVLGYDVAILNVDTEELL